jgi:hypothetical protein
MDSDELAAAGIHLNFTRECRTCGGEIRFENGQQIDHTCPVSFTPEEQYERNRLAAAVTADVLRRVMTWAVDHEQYETRKYLGNLAQELGVDLREGGTRG